MRPTARRIALLSAAALALAAPAWAQDEAETTDQPPAAEAAPLSPLDTLSLGEEVLDGDGEGEAYLAETFGDWEMRCIRLDGPDPCQLYQLLNDADGNSVAEISVFDLTDAGEAVAGATIVTPLETLLTQQITMRVDGGQARRYPFTFCSVIGCVSRIGLTAAEVESFRRGNVAQISIVPVVAPDQTVTLDISLIGFTAGFAAVEEANAALE